MIKQDDIMTRVEFDTEHERYAVRIGMKTDQFYNVLGTIAEGEDKISALKNASRRLREKADDLFSQALALELPSEEG